MADENAITGRWHAKREEIGRCGNCYTRPELTARVTFQNSELRLCEDCAAALRDLLDDMLATLAELR